MHKNKNCTVIVPYIIDNHSFLPFISLSLLESIYGTLSTTIDNVHVPTHILQSNRHSNKFVQVSFNCMSPLSRGSCGWCFKCLIAFRLILKNRVVCDNRELFDVPFVIENKCVSWKHAEESRIRLCRVDLSWIIVFSRLIKKNPGRFTLWSKGATNHTVT